MYKSSTQSRVLCPVKQSKKITILYDTLWWSVLLLSSSHSSLFLGRETVENQRFPFWTKPPGAWPSRTTNRQRCHL